MRWISSNESSLTCSLLILLLLIVLICLISLISVNLFNWILIHYYLLRFAMTWIKFNLQLIIIIHISFFLKIEWMNFDEFRLRLVLLSWKWKAFTLRSSSWIVSSADVMGLLSLFTFFCVDSLWVFSTLCTLHNETERCGSGHTRNQLSMIKSRLSICIPFDRIKSNVKKEKASQLKIWTFSLISPLMPTVIPFHSSLLHCSTIHWTDLNDHFSIIWPNHSTILS